MNNYKELIVKCEEWLSITKRLKADDLTQHIEMCADAIEQLVKERDAAVSDLSIHGRFCVTCRNRSNSKYSPNCTPRKCLTDDNESWEWRGVQKGGDE